MKSFSSSLPMMLYRALDVVMPRFRTIFREFGLTEQQWRILRVLWERDEVSARELAEQALIPPQSLVGIVDRLEKRELVARRPNRDDRRGILVRVTANGQKLKELVTRRVDAAYRELRLSLDPIDWKQLQHGLDCICKIDAVVDDHAADASKQGMRRMNDV